MKIEIREGSLEELVSVNQRIVEFITPYGQDEFERRLEGRSWYGLVAEDATGLLGFKIGYEESPQQFYSWLGGVVPEARGKGLARRMLHRQEAWVQDSDYTAVRVKSRNRYRAMLILLLSEGYEIIDIEPHDPPTDSRIHFLKTFPG